MSQPIDWAKLNADIARAMEPLTRATREFWAKHAASLPKIEAEPVIRPRLTNLRDKPRRRP